MKTKPNKKTTGKGWAILDIRWLFRAAVRGLRPGRFRGEKPSGRGVVFVKRGQFVPGRDPITSIDWKTIFMSRPVSVFREKPRNTVNVFLVDVSLSMFSSAHEHRTKKDIADLIIGLAPASAHEGNYVGLIAFDHTVRESHYHYHGPGGLRGLVEKIRNLEPEPADQAGRKTDLGPALALAAEFGLRNAQIFILSDFNFPCACQRELEMVCSSNSVIPLVVSDRWDDTPWLPKGAYIMASDAETGESGCFRNLAKNTSFLEVFDSLGLPYLTIYADETEEEIIGRLVEFAAMRRF